MIEDEVDALTTRVPSLVELARHSAIRTLVRAFECAQDVARDHWEFAVEIAQLRDLGLSHCDLRWLVCKQYIEHALEIRSPTASAREFSRNPALVFTESSCFIATRSIVEVVRRYGPSPVRTLPRSAATDSPPAPVRLPPKPCWDPVRRELRVGDKIVKRYRVPAPIQELILSAFAEDGWVERIDDPLPPSPKIDQRRRLQAAIMCLNRNQKHRLVHFCGDGNGEGVRWELVELGSRAARRKSTAG